jgi:predicted O-methyltransferase YrrM
MNKLIYYLIRYLKGIRLILKATLQLKKYKVGAYLLSRYLFQSISIFLFRYISNKKISEDFNRYAKKELTLTFNWFGQNAQVWVHFFKKFNLENKKINILEIGTFEGLSSSFFLKYLKKSNLVAVDSLDKKTSFYKNFLKNKSKLRSFKFHNLSSKDFFKKKIKDEFDIIYIDGGHDKNSVIDDAKSSFKVLKKNGILIFDDMLYEYQNDKIKKKFKESDFVIGGVLIFLSKFKNVEILYAGHQLILKKK